jgi:hypothetical protein
MTSTLGELFTFRNWVHVGGYEILEEPVGKTQAILLGKPWPPRTTAELLASGPPRREIVFRLAADGTMLANDEGLPMEPRYPLTKSENIAREFAKVGPTDKALLAFVDQYGLLWPWGDHRNTVDQFRMAQKNVRTVLKEINRANREDTADDRRAALRQVEARLAWNNVPLFNCRPKYRHLNDGGPSRLEADNLRSAIGLMLFYEISDHIEWATCAQCGKAFPKGGLGERVRRRDADTCSKKCLQIILNARKAEEAKKRAEAAPVFKPRACLHCGETFIPKRDTTEHCGKPACKQAIHRMRVKADTSAKKSKSTRGAAT